MLRYTIFIFCFLWMCRNEVQAQDPIYSQFYAAPLQVNPAFTGKSYAPTFTFNYRNQWPALSAYNTYSLSFDRFFKKINSGLGIMILTDDAGKGLIKNTKIATNYAYRLTINKDFFIKMGVELAWTQSRYNWEAFTFGDQLDPFNGAVSPGGTPYPTEEIAPDRLSVFYTDIGAGLLVYSKKYYGGFSVKHINTPNESLLNKNENILNGLPYRFTLHGGAQIDLNPGNKAKSKAFVSPNATLITQGNMGQINVGSYFGYGAFYTGAWYRHAWTNPDAVIALIGFQKNELKIGYSYDFTISKLGRTGGSHEISLTITPDEPEKDINDCFQLFR